MSGERWLVVDGNNLLMRAIHALRDVGLTNEQGVNTGPLNTFITMIARYVHDEHPDRVVVCWDSGHDYRSALWPSYKANRTRNDDLLEVQTSSFALAKRFCAYANVPQQQVAGVEADDLVATYWTMRDDETQFVIVSGDKDLLQLLRDGRVFQIRPGTNDDYWSAARVRDEYGCEPQQLAYAMAFAGDTSDGIDGVRGVGLKTAVKWLAKHDWSFARVFENEHSPKLGDDARDIVVRNHALIALPAPVPGLLVPVPPRFSPTKGQEVMGTELLRFFDTYQLATLRQRLLDGSLWGEAQQTSLWS